MLALFLGLCLSVAHCVPITDADEGSLTVNIDTGPIRGKHALNLSRKFLGIPFAAPPLGELRWKAPAAPASWTAVRDTTALPKSCPQPKNGLAWGETQEDCLYLNVYAPRNADKPVPVMVWFYGGSWEYGGTSLPLYDGADTTGRDDVVIVTVNYRLGVLGFLGSEALRAADGSTGNYGIQDQRSALEWVQRNIAVFGGDKTRVTIFGQSAGSGSVATHLLSPRSQGLFHRAIMQSGPVADWTSKNMSLATTNYNAVVDHVNCTRPHTADTLSCLRQANVSDLLSAHVVKFLVDWAPVIDGVDVVEEAQARAAAGNWSSKVPIMLGTVKDEGTTLMGGIDYDATVDDYKAWLQKKYAPYADELFQMYPPKSTDKGAAFYAASAVFTDDAMACPARRTARWISRVDDMPPAYLYHFMHTLALVSPDKKLGCFHGTEIAFVFEIFPMLIEVGEQRLGRDMADAWTRFAATGNPNPSSDAVSSDWPKAGWPAYTQTGDNNFVFQTGLLSPELSVQSALKHANCDWWDQRPGQPL